MPLWSSGVLRRCPVVLWKRSYNRLEMAVEERADCQHQQDRAQGVDNG